MMPFPMELPVTLRPDILPAPLSAMLCANLAIAVCVKFRYSNLLRQDTNQLLQRAYNINVLSAGHDVSYRQYRFWATLLFLLNASVLVTLCNTKYAFSTLIQPVWLQLAVLTPLAVGGFFLLTQILAGVFGWLWHAEKAFHDYIEYMWLTLRMLSMCILCCIWLLPYLSEAWSMRLTVAIAILFALLTLARWIKGTACIIQRGFSVLFFIAYLCTAEFVPVFIIWKIWK